MFDLSLPWWEFILRGVIVYGALLVLVRLSGKRTVGQFTPFDLLVVMLLAKLTSNCATPAASSSKPTAASRCWRRRIRLDHLGSVTESL